MIESDQESDRETKKLHIDNLYSVVSYCENRIECRRVQMLMYFGECDYNPDECRRNQMTVCDNCASDEIFEIKNLVSHVTNIVNTVKTLVHNNNPLNNKNINKITMCHLIDIYKGSQLAKIIQANHDRCELFGLGKLIHRNDAERLFKVLVMKRVLAEELHVGTHENIIVYIKLGPLYQSVFELSFKFDLQVRIAVAPNVINPNTMDRSIKENISIDDPVERIYNDCEQALLEARNAICDQTGLHNPSMYFPIEAIREISRKLPTTYEDAYQIDGVTTTRMKTFGEKMFEITKFYQNKLWHAEPLSKNLNEVKQVSKVSRYSTVSNRPNYTKFKKPKVHKFKKKSYSQFKSSSNNKTSGWINRNQALTTSSRPELRPGNTFV